MTIEDLMFGTDLKQGDEKRLGEGYKRTFNVMKDGIFRTPDEIARLSGNRLDSALRYLRYMKARGHRYNKMRKERGLYMYQILPSFDE